MSKNNIEEVKCRLKVVMAEEDVKVTELSSKTGLNANYLSDIRNNLHEIGIRNALIISKALNTSIHKIWQLKENNPE